MQFNYGIECGEIKYGWYKKELYRLPYINNKRSYSLLKLNIVMNGMTECYCINRRLKTLNSLKMLTKKVDWKVEIIKDKDCPF